jgi:hypothetical protein
VNRFLWIEGVRGAKIQWKLSEQCRASVLPQRSKYEWTNMLKNRQTTNEEQSGSQTTPAGKVLSPYCGDSLQWIFAPLTPSARKELIIARCSSFVYVVSGAPTLMPLVMNDKEWMMMVRNSTATIGRFCAHSAVGSIAE